VALASGVWVTAFTDFLTIMDRIWIQVTLIMINGIATIGLTLVLAPRLGLLGAVISISFVTVCFWTWLVPLLVQRFFAAHPEKLGQVGQLEKFAGEEDIN